MTKSWGDVWTWTALGAETKLVPRRFVGARDSGAVYHFINDLAGRLASRIQLTTEGHKPYVETVEGAFRTDTDYAQLVKPYGNESGPKENAEMRYSPAQCMGACKAAHYRQLGIAAHVHQFYRGAESHDAEVHATIHSVDKRSFKKI
ncbi:MAG: hypothetical protein ACLQVW_08695 [Limisphaerales bacterium]